MLTRKKFALTTEMKGIKIFPYRSSPLKGRASCFGRKSVLQVGSEPGAGKVINSLLPVEYAK